MKIVKRKLENDFNELMKSADTFPRFIEQIRAFIHKYDEMVIWASIDFQRDTSNQKYEDRLKEVQRDIKPLLAACKKRLYDICLEKHGEAIENTRMQTILMHQQISFSNKNILIRQQEDEQINRYIQLIGSLQSMDEEAVLIHDLTALLFESDEDVRETAYRAIDFSYQHHAESLQSIFSELIRLRHEKAKNLELEHYVAYAFMELGRIDYTSKECMRLALAVQKHIVPLKEVFQEEQTRFLAKQQLRPWDVRISPYSDFQETASTSVESLLETVGIILSNLDPSFHKVLKELESQQHLDLEGRAYKASGGFCEFLPESETSFLFMNRTQTFDDVVILIHELGHAVHHDLMKDAPDNFQQIPMEVAEFAAMTFELLSMEFWHLAIEDAAHVRRAKLEQFRLVIEFLPQTIIVDQFQEWLYRNPVHTVKERNEQFASLRDRFDSNAIDWSTISRWKGEEWLSIIHLFETPFYYIEYAMAQIAALQMYRKYKEQPQQTIEAFKTALRATRTHSVKEVYALAGVSFDVSEHEMQALVCFVQEEIDKLQQLKNH
ncbi:M3 family metallopeptidase [Exiguobacterium sp. s166]|uniref:M3 family metallopeptidase n=1 Tax=Exiguobacterium sp. s166 TaxID=2751204 RepID=UPI001BE5F2CF|nr:M3 family metallopeptidase [Exiguobacterium sp. s166]